MIFLHYFLNTVKDAAIQYTTKYHLLNGSASNVVRTGRSVNGHTQIARLQRSSVGLPAPLTDDR
jgi:hypothetical protein